MFMWSSFDPLPGGEMVMHQGGTNAQNFVGADRRSNTTTDGNSAVHIACCDCLGERKHEIRIVIVGIQAVRAEIHNIMASFAKLGHEFPL
jgi:hypothetical protein